MALINCPECGKEISDQATSCPFCGFPQNTGQQVTKDKNDDGDIEVVSSYQKANINPKRRKYYIIGGIAIVVVIMVVLLVQFLNPLLQYNNAVDLLDGGHFDEAISQFVSLGQYRDSESKINLAYQLKYETLYRPGFWKSPDENTYLILLQDNNGLLTVDDKSKPCIIDEKLERLTILNRELEPMEYIEIVYRESSIEMEINEKIQVFEIVDEAGELNPIVGIWQVIGISNYGKFESIDYDKLMRFTEHHEYIQSTSDGVRSGFWIEKDGIYDIIITDKKNNSKLPYPSNSCFIDNDFLGTGETVAVVDIFERREQLSDENGFVHLKVTD